MEQAFSVAGFIFGLVTTIILVVLFFRLRGAQSKGNDETAFKLLFQQMNEQTRTLDAKLHELTKTVDSKMGETTRHVGEAMRSQFSESSKLIKEVTEGLTKLDETNRQVVSFADQLQNLQDILKNPKQRGILGEYYLETLLKNVLPPGNYKMQYAFGNGEIVDAAVFVKDKIIPVDSKFSLENYNRLAEARDPSEKERLEKLFINDLKTRIQETAKYIRPGEGTMDFAFMFIPAEAIYYDLLVNKVGALKINTQDLIQYAFNEKHVIIVSPTSFLAYLQTVLQALRALQIEESAKEVRKNVERLIKHFMSYEEYLKKLGGHLGTSVGMYNLAYKEYGKIDKDIMRITEGDGVGVEPLVLERPKMGGDEELS